MASSTTTPPRPPRVTTPLPATEYSPARGPAPTTPFPKPAEAGHNATEFVVARTPSSAHRGPPDQNTSQRRHKIRSIPALDFNSVAGGKASGGGGKRSARQRPLFSVASRSGVSGAYRDSPVHGDAVPKGWAPQEEDDIFNLVLERWPDLSGPPKHSRTGHYHQDQSPLWLSWLVTPLLVGIAFGLGSRIGHHL